MVDIIDEFFVKPMQFPDLYPPYNTYNTAAYAAIALIVAFLAYKYIRSRKIAIDPKFYWAVLPFIFMGAIMRVIQDAEILPRSLNVAGITFYPFITPGIYILMFLILGVIYLVAKSSSKENHEVMMKKIRNSGIGLSAVLFAILALWGLSRITLEKVTFMAAILLLASLGLLAFELIKSKIYNKRENALYKNLERTTLFSQVLDGAATFVGVGMGGYSEQHVVANAIFGIFGTPLSFFFVKLIFALAIIYALRKEAESADEHVYVLVLITVFGLAPGVRDALRLFFAV
ncbi:MAG: DUF63 family protein [Candidatus Micrarchaeota archaeon]